MQYLVKTQAIVKIEYVVEAESEEEAKIKLMPQELEAKDFMSFECGDYENEEVVLVRKLKKGDKEYMEEYHPYKDDNKYID